METSLDCVPCIVNSFLRLLELGNLSSEKKEQAMRRLLKFVSEADYKKSPPVLGREMHKMFRDELNNPDPYKEIKLKYNNMMMNMYSDFEEKIASAEDPFNMAMRLAIAGNVIDFGPQDQLDINETINRFVNSRIDIDDSKMLRKDLETANMILYIGDNCGEIVMDKLFLKTINLPNMYFAVRGGPVLNDVTLEDAQMVGMNKFANIITTGDNSPGAVWDFTSNEFQQIFNKADVIVSKGQGNLEGLMGLTHNIYYLLVTKCDRISAMLETKKGEFVVKKNPYNLQSVKAG